MVRDVLDQDGIPEISMSDSGSDEDVDEIDPQHYRSFTPDMGLAHLLSDGPQLPSDDTDPDLEVYVQGDCISDPALSPTSSSSRVRSSSNPTAPSSSSTIAGTDDQSPQSTAHSLNRNPSPSPSQAKS